jgi:hypothetical protein
LAERFKALVLKTSEGANLPPVRIWYYPPKKLNLLKGNSMKQVIDNSEYNSKSFFGCNDCTAYNDPRLCNELHNGSGNECLGIVWIKKEDTVVKAAEEITFAKEQTSSSENITFSSSQIAYLSEVFGIDATEEVLKVSDGFVKKSGKVWWKYQFGPEHAKASEHWDNIKGYPDLYSVKEPKYKVVYESNIS